MKKEEMIRAINEVDDDLLESAQKARIEYKEKSTKTAMIRRTVIALSTFAVLVAAVMITNSRRPEQPESMTAETAEPVPDDQQERIVLSLSHQMTEGGGMSVVMYPDLRQETDWNPWDTSMNLKELPVYERNLTPTGTAYDLSEEEMRAILHEYADWFGYTLSAEKVTAAGEYDERHKTYNEVPGVDDGTALYINADSEEARFTCFANGEVTVSFHEGYEPHVPQPLKMNVYDLSEEDAGKTAEYLAAQYGSLLSEGKIRWDIGGDFGYNSQPSEELGEKEGLFRIRHYTLWPEGNNDTETVVNYGLCSLQIWGYDPQDETLISGMRIADKRRAYQKTADYPLITAEEAYEQLLAGSCIANAGGILPDENTGTGDVQLVYRDSASSHYVYPCYLFSMDITDALKEKYSMEIEGVRQYGLYWVPAIDPAYYEWTDDPFSPSTAMSPGPEETAQTPDEPDTGNVPSEPEPVVTANSVHIDRAIQETDWYCTVACAQMILNHFGIYKDQNSLAAEMNTYAPGVREDGIKGTYDTDAARVLSEYLFGGQPQTDSDGGYRVQPVSTSFVQDEYDTFVSRIKKNIDDGYPSILQIRANYVYGGNITENHNVVVCGYEETVRVKYGHETTTLMFTIVDPYFDGPSQTGINDYEASVLYGAIINSVEPSYIW